MLSYPSSLKGHSDTPISINASCQFHLTWIALPWLEHHGNTGASGLSLQNLSLHAISLTPGLLSVQIPFTSWQALAFLLSVESQQLSRFSIWFIPLQNSFSYTCPAWIHEAALFVLYYGLQFWQAPLTEYDSPVNYQIAFAAPCRGKFSLDITAQTRPLPTHLKG